LSSAARCHTDGYTGETLNLGSALTRASGSPFRCYLARWEGDAAAGLAVPAVVVLRLPAAKGFSKKSESSAMSATPGLSWDHSWLPAATSPLPDLYTTWTTPRDAGRGRNRDLALSAVRH
jgi:hypothetical protein